MSGKPDQSVLSQLGYFIPGRLSVLHVFEAYLPGGQTKIAYEVFTFDNRTQFETCEPATYAEVTGGEFDRMLGMISKIPGAIAINPRNPHDIEWITDPKREGEWHLALERWGHVVKRNIDEQAP